MRAPVYRYLDAKNALLGLSLGEALAVLTVAWPAMITLPPLAALGAVAAAYLGLRIVGRGKNDGYLQHWVAWRARQWMAGGYLSAVARVPIPRFPFAPYEHRDCPSRGQR